MESVEIVRMIANQDPKAVANIKVKLLDKLKEEK